MGVRPIKGEDLTESLDLFDKGFAISNLCSQVGENVVEYVNRCVERIDAFILCKAMDAFADETIETTKRVDAADFEAVRKDRGGDPQLFFVRSKSLGVCRSPHLGNDNRVYVVRLRQCCGYFDQFVGLIFNNASDIDQRSQSVAPTPFQS